jgi:hypothetical protein
MVPRILAAVLMLFWCRNSCSQTAPPLLNFSHLEHLSEEIDFLGHRVTIVHVYANYPDYAWTGAAESGAEGIACVDDAARAAVLYVRHYQLHRDAASLAHARSLLEFVMEMQTADGEFYNFIRADHSINTTGRTSFKSFGWWGVRGTWALCTGYRVFRAIDPEFAGMLRKRLKRTFPRIQEVLSRYGHWKSQKRYKYPEWLFYGSGADVTSELLFGLTDYYIATHDTTVRSMIRKLADGIMMMQDGNARKYPYGLHRSWQTLWHMWGNGQTQTLAKTGKVLGDKRMLASAEREARGFYPRLLIKGFIKEMDITTPSEKKRYDQIAYGVRPMAVGLIRLYETTHRTEYATMAGLAASWLFGNNVLGETMYDPSTGRCFDGINDSITANKNSGAESTIEALATLIEVERYPEAARYLSSRKVRSVTGGDILSATFRNSEDDEVTLSLDTRNGKLRSVEHRHK